ncbi:hypothetical protein JCM10296v2_000574 [Rhodotorula toruloides]
MAPTNIPVTLGLMTWGEEGTPMARVHDLETCEQMLDVFVSHGHNEVDSALAYCNGTSEEYLGKLNWKSRGVLVDTKLWPMEYKGEKATFTLDKMRKFLDVQLAALKTDCLNLWYLHAPDYGTPIAGTLEAANTLHQEGKFKRFGISNYCAKDVEEFCDLADKHGWVKPSAYQGIYNALHRTVETELFPILRKHNISFYEFNPLGGGFFVGRLKKEEGVEKGSRFDPNTAQGKNYRNRYWRDEYFRALDLIQPVASSHSLTLAEIALRWIENHSHLSRDRGDNVLIGASSVRHLKDNLRDLEKGPLPEDVLDALDKAWEIVKPVASLYYRSPDNIKI